MTVRHSGKVVSLSVFLDIKEKYKGFYQCDSDTGCIETFVIWSTAGQVNKIQIVQDPRQNPEAHHGTEQQIPKRKANDTEKLLPERYDKNQSSPTDQALQSVAVLKSDF